MPTLILSPRYSDGSPELRRAAIAIGREVMRRGRLGCPDDFEPEEPVLFAEPLFNRAVAGQLGLTIVEPAEDLLVMHPREYVGRELRLILEAKQFGIANVDLRSGGLFPRSRSRGGVRLGDVGHSIGIGASLVGVWDVDEGGRGGRDQPRPVVWISPWATAVFRPCVADLARGDQGLSLEGRPDEVDVELRGDQVMVGRARSWAAIPMTESSSVAMTPPWAIPRVRRWPARTSSVRRPGRSPGRRAARGSSAGGFVEAIEFVGGQSDQVLRGVEKAGDPSRTRSSGSHKLRRRSVF